MSLFRRCCPHIDKNNVGLLSCFRQKMGGAPDMSSQGDSLCCGGEVRGWRFVVSAAPRWVIHSFLNAYSIRPVHRCSETHPHTFMHAHTCTCAFIVKKYLLCTQTQTCYWEVDSSLTSGAEKWKTSCHCLLKDSSIQVRLQILQLPSGRQQKTVLTRQSFNVINLFPQDITIQKNLLLISLSG